MKFTKRILAISLAIGAISLGNAQEEETRSNVQTFTPSKLLKKGQWDIKTFHSLYTQTKSADENGDTSTITRGTFFTNTNEIYTGISESSRINVGFIFQIRSNQIGGNALEALRFRDNGNSQRSGLTQIAPSVRIQPFQNIGNFSFTSSFYIPVFKDKADTVPEDNITSYLDQKSYTWETKFFYDKTFGGNKWQLFTEIDTRFNFGKNSDDADPTENAGELFFNNSLFLPISAFLSYFPSAKSTVFINAQQAFLIDLGNDATQDYTNLGFGAKYQLTDVINLEASYGNFVRGTSTGLGQSFSLGARFLF